MYYILVSCTVLELERDYDSNMYGTNSEEIGLSDSDTKIHRLTFICDAHLDRFVIYRTECELFFHSLPVQKYCDLKYIDSIGT